MHGYCKVLKCNYSLVAHFSLLKTTTKHSLTAWIGRKSVNRKSSHPKKAQKAAVYVSAATGDNRTERCFLHGYTPSA